MPRYSKVKGLAVVTMAEGKRVGNVDELVIDSDRKAIRWLRLRRGGISGERFWIPMEAVHGVGEHAVTINAEADVRNPADAAEAEELAKAKRLLVGSKAVTESGDYVGQVKDYEFAPDTFALSQLYIPLSRFGQVRVIPATKVLTIGKDVTILAGDALKQAETDAGDNQTGTAAGAGPSSNPTEPGWPPQET